MLTQIVITANKLIVSKEVLENGRGKLSSHLASQIRAIVVISFDHRLCPDALEFLHWCRSSPLK